MVSTRHIASFTTSIDILLKAVLYILYKIYFHTINFKIETHLFGLVYLDIAKYTYICEI